ncbi:uncharacterized protein [Clytia hemisphaerica]|uniref:uncharacterized protein n=1 Tax=Clytia hemisphaerica TaxID=252671 RepID=UPI0034D597D1
MSVKSSPLIWTNEKEIMLLREVLVSQPHQFKEKTPKRGEKWQQIADNLNKSDQFNNKASTRAVREKTNALIHAFRQTQRAELAATGISPDPTEKEVLCEEICLQIDEFTRILAESGKAAKDVEKDKLLGEDIRQKAMESQSQTLKRKSESSDEEVKKRRSSGSDAVCFLREKSEADVKMREKELEVQTQRLQLEATKIQNDQNNFINMFALMSNQMQQNQQMTLNIIERLTNSDKGENGQ